MVVRHLNKKSAFTLILPPSLPSLPPLGLGGLGIEVAKNVILAGVKSVTLFDPTPTTPLDLASQFYLSEKELGQARDKASAPKLAELNPYVPVHVLEGGREGGQGLSEEEVTKFRVVCATDQPLAEQLRLNAMTHPAVRLSVDLTPSLPLSLPPFLPPSRPPLLFLRIDDPSFILSLD